MRASTLRTKPKPNKPHVYRSPFTPLVWCAVSPRGFTIFGPNPPTVLNSLALETGYER